MQIANLEFPDHCPEQCKGKDEPWTHGGLCSRCPVFNVPEVVSADSYNPTWAAEYHSFINGGPEPKLLFSIVESDEPLDVEEYESISELTLNSDDPIVWAYEFVNESGHEFDNDRVVEWFEASIAIGRATAKDFNTRLRDAVVGFNFTFPDDVNPVLEFRDNGFSCGITYGIDVLWDSEHNEFGDDPAVIVYKAVERYHNILVDRAHNFGKSLDGVA